MPCSQSFTLITIYLTIYLIIYLPIYISTYLATYQSINRSISQSVNQSITLFIYLPTNLPCTQITVTNTNNIIHRKRSYMNVLAPSGTVCMLPFTMPRTHLRLRQTWLMKWWLTELLLLLLGAAPMVTDDFIGPKHLLDRDSKYEEYTSIWLIATRIQLILSTFSNIVNEKRRYG